MISAWKFLDERSRGIFSGFSWPTPPFPGDPGPWVEAVDVVACERGIHSCTIDDLSWWMSAQLWEIELDGALRVGDRKIVAERGRLVRQVSEWTTLGENLAAWAVSRVKANTIEVLGMAGETTAAAQLEATTSATGYAASLRGLVCDPASPVGIAVAQIVDAADDVANPILACHDAARSAGHLASAEDRSVTTFKSAFAAERSAQSQWIAARM
jgi:hypothetical protein